MDALTEAIQRVRDELYFCYSLTFHTEEGNKWVELKRGPIMVWQERNILGPIEEKIIYALEYSKEFERGVK